MGGSLNFDFAKKIIQASTYDEAKEHLQSAIEAFGYTAFTYAIMPTKPDASLSEFISLDTLRADWMELYEEQQLYFNDPIINHFLTKDTPYLWSELTRQCNEGLLSTEETKVENLSRDFGVKTGITLLLPSGISHRAGISLVGDPDFSSEEHDHQWQARHDDLITLVEIFHACFQKEHWLQQHYELTKHERSLLSWFAQGLPQKQIAYKAKIPQRTLEEQLRRIREKMNAESNIAAAIRAVEFGIID